MQAENDADDADTLRRMIEVGETTIGRLRARADEIEAELPCLRDRWRRAIAAAIDVHALDGWVNHPARIPPSRFT